MDQTGDRAIEVRGLHKWFGATHALRGIDLTVPAGTVYGLLGPNGAGKSTTVRVLTTLATADQGDVRVAGVDVRRDPAAVRFRIGLAGQHAAVDEKITGAENLRLFGRLYHLPERVVRARADELLVRFGLADAAGRLVRTYSGGMRRRLDLAASLFVAPTVLFLDEPTTGLDPRSRNEVWEVVRALAAEGTTILLTTQYLDEADQLAHRIAVVDTGTVIASGTPDELKTQVGGDRVEAVVAPHDLARAAEALGAATAAAVRVDEARSLVSAPSSHGAATLTAALRELDAAGIATQDLALRRPTLDDVFLRLTGHGAGAAPASGIGGVHGADRSADPSDDRQVA